MTKKQWEVFGYLELTGNLILPGLGSVPGLAYLACVGAVPAARGFGRGAAATGKLTKAMVSQRIGSWGRKEAAPLLGATPVVRLDPKAKLSLERQALLAQVEAMEALPEEKETYREAVEARYARLLSEFTDSPLN